MQIKSEYRADYTVTEVDHGKICDAIQFVYPRDASFASNPAPESRPNCILLAVTSVDGVSWLGSFQSGSQGTTGLFTTPSADTFCLVLEGQGYWVPTDKPEAYECVTALPILKVIATPRANRLVFSDFTDLVAYGPNGLVWATERLSWDGLTITEVTDEYICGRAWDSPANREVQFEIEVVGGKIKGGAG